MNLLILCLLFLFLLLSGCSLLEPDDQEDSGIQESEQDSILTGSITVIGKPDSTIPYAHWLYTIQEELKCSWNHEVQQGDHYVFPFTHQAVILQTNKPTSVLEINFVSVNIPSHWWINLQTFNRCSPLPVVSDTLTPSRFAYETAPETILEDLGLADINDRVYTFEYRDYVQTVSLDVDEPCDLFLLRINGDALSGQVTLYPVENETTFP